VYLKAIEMTGFKSFADKTVLHFEPGMTCVVGPNGCGKSNISDAVRWVLGEQSAKALRGSQMVDCIFNGTDDRKPLGMAEVGITFADCEQSLGTEYNEVTVSRRVFRSGEGQYFINKTPCRLKDIQRLFMDTGIGTASYSMMEQGRIDQILSSRPEDRRTIFEEASGITKFKNDKKEAIRKLEHTEANLLRLSDVIREVKRQIGSLQRQAGKARRYKTLTEELRKLDIFTTRRRLGSLDDEIRKLETEAGRLNGKVAAGGREIQELEEGNAVLRKSLVTTEHEIGTVLEQSVQAQSRLDHTHEMIAMNRQRIDEYRSWSERGSREIGETEKQIEAKRNEVQDLADRMAAAHTEHEEAERQLATQLQEYEEGRKRVDDLREQIRRFRDESVETESLLARLQNQLIEVDSSERTSAIRRERLAAEKAQLSREVQSYEKRKAEMTEALAALGVEVESKDQGFAALMRAIDERQDVLRNVEREHADLKARLAATEARIGVLSQNKASAPRATGTKLLLGANNPLGIGRESIVGELTSLLEVEPDYRTAVDACLRTAVDTILVRESETGMRILRSMAERGEGPVRLMALDRLHTNQPPAGHRLVDHVRCDSHVRPALECLLGHALVAESLEDIPSPPDPHATYVTRSGCIVGGSGWMEFWMAAPGESSPFTLDGLLSDASSELSTICAGLDASAASVTERQAELERMRTTVNESRQDLDACRRAFAQKEGESQVIEKETQEARNRLDTVSWELGEIESQDSTGDAERQRITQEMESLRAQREQIAERSSDGATRLHEAESGLSTCQSALTEQRIHTAGLRQNEVNTADRCEAARIRIAELETTARDRSEDLLSYEDKITALKESISSAEAQLSSFEEDVSACRVKAEGLRKNREKQGQELEKLESYVSQQRASVDELRNAKSALDVQCAEARMRRQNQLDRLVSEYNMTVEQIDEEPEPEWDNAEAPSLDAAETMVAELRTKIEAMGPVNLVAIEEYKELEERYAFLTEQEQDLVNSKEQLHDMIRKINRTTSEMFRTTFDQVNTNFQLMFQKLFNGGSAKLVLVNEEDVLDCGIEIIARPPGKRLQNVSLLSGGERTLTAVALLFSIYMIKPSPFCLLDELDAALDDSNIGRFVKALQSFLEQSQFLVITHNRQTIAAARTLYGVTMPDKGISRIVSMRFHDYKGEGVPANA